MTDIYAYDDYVLFLQDWFKAARGRPSQATVAKRMGCSTGTLSGIVSGKSRLTDRWLEPLVEAMRLTQQVPVMFRLLVNLSRTQSQETRDAIETLRQDIIAYRSSEKVIASNRAAVRHWYYAAIAELAAHPSFREDPEWIASTLRPPITVEQATQALDALFTIGRLVRVDDQIVVSNVVWATGHQEDDDLLCEDVRQFHHETNALSASALDRFAAEERYLTGATFSIPRDALPELVEHIHRLQRHILRICADHANDGGDVFYMGLQVFPMSDTRTHP